MDAKGKSFSFLGNEGQVTIPFFQRGYVWTESNWSDLLADLLNTNRRHFLGSLILKQQRPISGEPKNVMVIDGQQRLTTLSILVKAVFDSLPVDIRDNCKPAVRTHLFFKRNPTDRNYLVRIKHSHVDADAYSAAIKAGLDGPEMAPDAHSPNRIVRCYGYFRSELEKRSEEEIAGLFNRVLHPEERMLVVIDLDEADDEQTIFDTTNTAGVRLSGADIVKNAIFQRAIQLLSDEQQGAIALYDRTWKEVFLQDDETVQFWEKEKLTGRIKRDNSEILLHSFAIIKGFYDPDEHLLSDLSKLYKDTIAQLKSEDELVEFIEELTRYAVLYRAKIPEFGIDSAFSFSDASRRLFHILDVLQISTFHPFILHVLHTHRADETRAAAILSEFERFLIRRVLAHHETKNFNKLARDFISDSTSLSKEAESTTDEDVVKGLKDISNKNAALVLFWIELRRRSLDRKFDTSELKYDYSLEHIMPQKWEQHWKNLPDKRNSAGEIMGLEEAKQDRNEKVYWIGNMTLLTSSLNSSLKNYTFEKKVVGDGRKKGVKAYASLSITNDDIVAPYDRGESNWDEARIIERTNLIAKEVLAIWGAELDNTAGV
jgi:uncharacterized protein with ParB-like and HNH nuclease domain